ncbi:MAG: hypothetical protein ACI9G1_001718 [Pirellulaceae bacterium]|jgi:hypothetical protein
MLRFHTLLHLLTAGLVALAVSFPILAEDTASPPIRPADCCPAEKCRSNDSFWLISTRHLGSTNGCGNFDLKFSRVGACEAQTCASRGEFLADESFGRTLFYVHGNRISPSNAIQRARTLHKEISCKICDDRPIRLVVWSWPSERVRGPVNDIRAKGERTNSESFYLGQLLQEMPADKPIDFVGYSFGSRIVTGALHLANGGGIRKVALPNAAQIARGRIVLMAPAIHSDWLLSGRKHERALDSNDGILVLYNSCDPALKHYRFIEKCSKPAALGFVGLANCGTVSPAYAQKNVSHVVGKSHDEYKYLCSPCIIGLIADQLCRKASSSAPEIAIPEIAAPEIAIPEIAAEPAIETASTDSTANKSS